MKVLHKHTQLAWKFKTIPGEWKTAMTMPIFNNTRVINCNNYKFINDMLQIYEIIIEQILRVKSEKSFTHTQSCMQD